MKQSKLLTTQMKLIRKSNKAASKLKERIPVAQFVDKTRTKL